MDKNQTIVIIDEVLRNDTDEVPEMGKSLFRDAILLQTEPPISRVSLTKEQICKAWLRWKREYSIGKNIEQGEFIALSQRK
jgi:hypothetical protein